MHVKYAIVPMSCMGIDASRGARPGADLSSGSGSKIETSVPDSVLCR